MNEQEVREEIWAFHDVQHLFNRNSRRNGEKSREMLLKK